LPSEIMIPIELHNQFPDHEDNGRIDHRTQTEAVHFEIGNETSEQLNDYKKRQDIDNNDVKRLTDRPLEKKLLDFVERLEQTHNKYHDNEQSQYNDDPLKGLAEYYLCIRNLHTFLLLIFLTCSSSALQVLSQSTLDLFPRIFTDTIFVDDQMM